MYIEDPHAKEECSIARTDWDVKVLEFIKTVAHYILFDIANRKEILMVKINEKRSLLRAWVTPAFCKKMEEQGFNPLLCISITC